MDSNNQKPIEGPSALRLRLMGDIVSAYVSKHDVEPADLTRLMREVHQTLIDLSGEATSSDGLVPAVPISESVTPDFIYCLEDGKQLKMLKRYLRSQYGLSPDEYRAKWGLPPDYPMVAPNYAKKRSAFAREIGLGTKRVGKPTSKKKK